LLWTIFHKRILDDAAATENYTVQRHSRTFNSPSSVNGYLIAR
jgi:hypothetical protein